jgi:hypothetical protein
MKLLALALTLVAAAAAAKKNSSNEAAKPNASLAKSYGGRVWASDSPPPTGGDELRSWLAAQHGIGELGRKAKEGPWTVAYVAVFKHPAAKGPVTVKFFDKNDQKNMVEESSSANDAATLVYHGSYELDPDHGFNKGHTYVVKVGQIIKGKFQPYASGEVTLK